MRIISGGQTGVDQGALQAAHHLELSTGGTAPKGWRTEAGPAPWLKDFGLVECSSLAYIVRTRANILHAEATLILGKKSVGSQQTMDYASSIHNYPVIWLPLSVDVWPNFDLKQWIRSRKIKILNVAGNRESVNPGVQRETRKYLTFWLGKLVV